ncbi:MAG: sulfite exporter TauE/SafE family protein [Candidatus Andersenbacteria bacterium]
MTDLLLLAALTFIASTVGTISGFGTSTIMIPVLVLFLSPIEAIFLVAIVHWFGDLWKVLLFRKGVNFRLVILLGVVGLVASYFGASVSLGAGEAILIRLLGAFLAGYAVFLITQKKFRIPTGTITTLIGGVLSGFFAGIFGIGGPIRSMVLSAFNLRKSVYIATAGAIGLMVDVTRIITYVAGGVTLREQLWWSLLLLIPVSFVGAQVARKIVNKVPQRQFRAVVAVFFLIIGLKLLVFPS